MLLKIIKELGTHSLIYLSGSMVTILSSILLLPVYTRFYGILEIVDSIRGMLIIVMLAGFVPAMAKFYKTADTKDKQKEIISTSFWFILLSGFVWVMSLWAYDKTLAGLFFSDKELFIYIDLALALLFIEALIMVGINYLNIEKRSKASVIWTLSRLFLNIGANIYFIVFLRLGAKGMLYGNLLSSAAICIFLTIYWSTKNGLSFKFGILGRMLNFGLPFIPSTFCASLMHRVDRYLLQRLTSLSDVGLYGLGYKFPFMLNSLMLTSFGYIWNASILYEIAEQKDCYKIYAKIATYFITIFIICQYGLAVMAPTVVKLLAAPEYYEAWPIVQIVGLGLCFYCFHSFFVIGAFIKTKTWFLPISYTIAALVNIVLNCYFLPRYGYISAAWVTVITYFIFSFFGFVVFRQFYPIPFEFGRLGFLLFTSISLVIVCNTLYFQNGILQFFKQVGFLITLPLILLFSSFLDQDERDKLYEISFKICPKAAMVSDHFRKR